MVTMSQRPVDRRPAPAARRTGYTIAAGVNLVLLYLVNVRPGWAAVPFLTDDTATVLPLINLSLIVGVAINALYLGYDARWFVALGGLATTGVGLVVLARLWQVFPFSFGVDSVWPLVFRVTLLVAIGGSVIALIVQVVQLVSGLSGRRSARTPPRSGPAR